MTNVFEVAEEHVRQVNLRDHSIRTQLQEGILDASPRV